MPLEEALLRPINLTIREGDHLSRLRVELLAVAELVPQPWADQQPMD
jgi:hypothetical protein